MAEALQQESLWQYDHLADQYVHWNGERVSPQEYQNRMRVGEPEPVRPAPDQSPPTEHKALPVAGYTSQPSRTVAAVNINKEWEERLLRRLEHERLVRVHAVGELPAGDAQVGQRHPRRRRGSGRPGVRGTSDEQEREPDDSHGRQERDRRRVCSRVDRVAGRAQFVRLAVTAAQMLHAPRAHERARACESA